MVYCCQMLLIQVCSFVLSIPLDRTLTIKQLNLCVHRSFSFSRLAISSFHGGPMMIARVVLFMFDTDLAQDNILDKS